MSKKSTSNNTGDSLKEMTINTVFNGLSEDRKIHILIKHLKLCNIEKLYSKLERNLEKIL